MAKSAALRKIESLDPEKDAWEIVRLCVFYEFPWDFNRALELALYKTFAVPSISRILHLSGEFEKHAQKRYDDTDLLLSEIIENGLTSGGRGMQALDRINWMHSNYRISNEDYLYVLGTFIFETSNWINQFGYRELTSKEELAGFYIWTEIGRKMHIEAIPSSIQEFRQFYTDYEKKYFAFSEANLKVARATEDLLLGWYMPAFMFETARPLLHAVMEPHLLKAFRYKEPGPLLRTMVKQALRSRSLAESMIPRSKPYIRTKDHKHHFYPDGYAMEDLGPDKLFHSSKCPYHKLTNSIK
ncbi:MAG: oxygenase MpaB family protein [Chitinophagales bacterium]